MTELEKYCPPMLDGSYIYNLLLISPWPIYLLTQILQHQNNTESMNICVFFLSRFFIKWHKLLMHFTTDKKTSLSVDSKMTTIFEMLR